MQVPPKPTYNFLKIKFYIIVTLEQWKGYFTNYHEKDLSINCDVLVFNTIIKVQRGFALYNKGNHQQNEKATYQMRENISKSNVW